MVTAEELLETATRTHRKNQWQDVLSCSKRPIVSCSILRETCAPGQITQTESAQRAAVRVRSLLTGEDEGELVEKTVDLVCPMGDPERRRKAMECRRKFRAAGPEVDDLAQALMAELGYTTAYIRNLIGRIKVYRGVALSPSHPAVKKIDRDMKAGRPRAYLRLGVQYTPKPLESWTMSKSVASDFAKAQARRFGTIPVLLYQTIYIEMDPISWTV